MRPGDGRDRLIFEVLRYLPAYLPERDRATSMLLYEAPAGRGRPGPNGDAVAQNEHR
jgi:hypothetical protein